MGSNVIKIDYTILITIVSLCCTFASGIVLLIIKVFDHFTKKKLDAEMLKELKEVTNSFTAQTMTCDKKMDTIYTKIDRMDENTDKAHQILNERDTNGMPLCYVPRGWAEIQNDIVKTMQKISESQRDVVSILQRMERKSDSTASLSDTLNRLNDTLTNINKK